MTTLVADIVGASVWTPGLEGWAAWVEDRHRTDALDDRGDRAPSSRRPQAQLLPAAERRRVPDGVAVALEVAREAMEASRTAGLDTEAIASVFASAHGDLAIVDYLCATLADDPASLSPTRFHHSVHNAASGYWSIAAQDPSPTTAIAAGEHTFAAGLLEATTQVVVEDRAVLLAAFDTPAVGPLVAAAPNARLFGAALVLVPRGTVHPSMGSLAVTVDANEWRAARSTAPHATLAALHASSPSARGVVLLDAVAARAHRSIDFPLGPQLTLSIAVACETMR